MTPATRAALAAAWAHYLAASHAIPLRMPWPEYLEEDERLWRAYRRAEAEILAEERERRTA